jgi:hypothetical protein
VPHAHVHFQKLPLQLSYDINKLDNWQQGDGMITNLFQTPKDDPVLYSRCDIWSYLEDFDYYSSEHLDLFHEEDYQPPLCSDLDRGKDIVCPEKDPCDNFFQPLRLVAVLIHTSKCELSPTHLVCPWRHNA